MALSFISTDDEIFCKRNYVNHTFQKEVDPNQRWTYAVLIFNQIHNIRRIFRQHSTAWTFNMFGQFLVHTDLLRGDSENDIDCILFDFQIDLWNAWIVQNRWMRIFSFRIQMALAVIWGNDAAQLKYKNVLMSGVATGNWLCITLPSPA